MKKGPIISNAITSKTGSTTGDFNIEFHSASFLLYTHLFHRENLYFNEENGEWHYT